MDNAMLIFFADARWVCTHFARTTEPASTPGVEDGKKSDSCGVDLCRGLNFSTAVMLLCYVPVAPVGSLCEVLVCPGRPLWICTRY